MEPGNMEPGNNSAPMCNVDKTPSDLGPVQACSEVGAADCFGNSDCMDNERCENIGGDVEVACCVPGPRGCKAAGEECESEFDCDEGVCIARADEPARCSMRCMGDEDCPEAVPSCNPVLGYCVTAGE